MLKAVSFLKRSQVPILGINIGRLGFLTGIQKENLVQGINFLKSKNFSLVKQRTSNFKNQCENQIRISIRIK